MPKLILFSTAIFLLAGGWLLYKIDRNISEAEFRQAQLRLENEAQFSIASFQNGVDRFAAIVSGIRSYIEISDTIPGDAQLQKFIQGQFRDNNIGDSLVVSYLNTDHIFQYSVTKNSLTPNNLKGADLKSFRSPEEIEAMDRLMESNEMKLFPPLNLVEGWVGIPLNFSVRKDGKVLGYFAPVINFGSIIEVVYSGGRSNEFVFRFSTGKGVEFDRAAVYDGGKIYNSKKDPESFKNYNMPDKAYVNFPFTIYGKQFNLGVAYKNQPERSAYRSVAIFLWFFILLLILSTGFLFWRTQLNKTRLLEQKNHELVTLNGALRYFANASSLDLKEPVRNIHAFSNLLKEKYGHKLDKKGLEFIGFIDEGVEKLNRLLNDLFTYSKTITAKEIAKENIDLNNLVNDVRNRLVINLKDKKIELKTSHLPVISGNYKLMHHLMENVMTYALRSNVKDEPVIEIGHSESVDLFLIYIKGNDIQVDLKYKDKIYDAYLGPEPELDTSEVGFTTCKKIVDQHNGRFWVESEPGIGSIFFFTIPKPSV